MSRELRSAPAAPGEGTADHDHDHDHEHAITRPEPTKAGLTVGAAEKAAADAAATVSRLSTPKLLVYFVVLIFGAWIIERLIGPIVAMAVLVIIGILGYRLLKWLATPAPDEKDV